ncbi:hypothetical protein LXA43DRAFT_713694 [Ganoderma leucocontextum]|nr:hypothetical protein LXA43DRAFT_713694 [Ganoderma leucocontextum]
MGTYYHPRVLFVCHLSNILSCLLAKPAYKGMSVTTTNVVASSLITRLLLNIRDPDLLQGRYHSPSDINSNGTPRRTVPLIFRAI